MTAPDAPAPAPVPGTGRTPRLAVEDLFADPEFSSPSISPDGTRLAYLAPHHGRRNVWMRGIGEDHGAAVPVTADRRRGISQYRWSEDSRWLLYLQDTDGNEDWHLFRVDLEAPQDGAVDLTPMPPGARVFGFEELRSRPGTVIAAMNPRLAHIDQMLIDLATGETTPHLTQEDPSEVVLLDGDARPAFAGRVHEDGTLEISAIHAETGRRRPVHRLGGAAYPVGIQPQHVVPDGSALVYGAYREADELQLLRLDHATGQESVLAAVPGASLDVRGTAVPGVLPPTLFLSRRTGEVVAARFVGPRPRIEVLDPDLADVFAALAGLSDGVLGTLTSDREERRWVATFVHDRDPAVSWLYDRATGESRELFRAHPQLDPADLAPMLPVDIPARDGLVLPSYLTLPLEADPRDLPLVLLVHGGPWFQDTWEFHPTVQLLADRGCAVLQVNFRGSLGYGRRHVTAAVGEFARAMHTDLLDAVDWAIARGIADPERVGIMGGSYGGYAALVGVTETPDSFAAAVDYVGVSDLASFLRSLPPFTRPYMANGWFRYVGDPDDPAAEAEMRARSPIAKVDRIRTPLLVAQGAQDARVPQAESDAIVAALRERGVAVRYLLAEDEGHGFENPENVIRLHHAVTDHFGQHLGLPHGPQPRA